MPHDWAATPYQQSSSKRQKNCNVFFLQRGQSWPSTPTLFTHYLDRGRAEQHRNRCECGFFYTTACSEIKGSDPKYKSVQVKWEVQAETAQVKTNKAAKTCLLHMHNALLCMTQNQNTFKTRPYHSKSLIAYFRTRAGSFTQWSNGVNISTFILSNLFLNLII